MMFAAIHEHHHGMADALPLLYSEATHLVMRQGPAYSRSTSWWRCRVAVVNVRVISCSGGCALAVSGGQTVHRRTAAGKWMAELSWIGFVHPGGYIMRLFMCIIKTRRSDITARVTLHGLSSRWEDCCIYDCNVLVSIRGDTGIEVCPMSIGVIPGGYRR